MTTSDGRVAAYISSSEIAAMPEAHVRHPWNADSEAFIKRLGVAAGLTRLALYLTRVPPGRESFLYHRHERDEEFLFILSGRGRAEIGERVIEVGAGDFMAFPAPDGPAHHLTNPYEEDLVYLMGGESSGLDIAHVPRQGRRLVFTASGILGLEDANCEQLTFGDWLVED